jgi:hypothetical protein
MSTAATPATSESAAGHRFAMPTVRPVQMAWTMNGWRAARPQAIARAQPSRIVIGGDVIQNR